MSDNAEGDMFTVESKAMVKMNRILQTQISQNHLYREHRTVKFAKFVFWCETDDLQQRTVKHLIDNYNFRCT